MGTIKGLFCPSKCVTSGKLLFTQGHGGGVRGGISKFIESKPNPGCASKNVGNNIINNNNFFIFKNLPLIFHLFFLVPRL